MQPYTSDMGALKVKVRFVGEALSTAGGTAQATENAFGDVPEPIVDADQVFDSESATLDRIARNLDFVPSKRRRFRIRRFLVSLGK